MIFGIAKAIAQEVEHAAGEATEHAAEHGPLLAEAEFWVAIAFVIFVLATVRPISKAVSSGLDGHAAKLQRQLDEARELREEAQVMLAESKRRQRDATQEAEQIVTAATEEAKRLAEKAAQDLEHAVTRRRELAEARIAHAEADVANEVRSRAIDIAVAAASQAMIEKLDGSAGDAATDTAIKEVAAHVN